MDMKKRDLITGIILLVLSIATLIESSKLPFGSFSSPDVGFFPVFLAILLGILSLFLLGHAIKGKGEEKTPIWASRKGAGPLVLTGVILFLFALFFESLGYPVSTFLLIGLLTRTIGRKKWWVVITVSFLSTLSTYILFDIILKAQLPMGIIRGIFGG
jgi:hypothetical protein